MTRYKGIHTIELKNCDVRLTATHKLRFWLNYTPTITVNKLIPRDGEASAVQDGPVLKMRNATTSIAVPTGRKTHVHAAEGSQVQGMIVGGNIQTDETSRANISVPIRFSRNTGPIAATLRATLEDLAYIAIGILPVLTLGAIILPLFEQTAVDHLGLFTIISAGAYVGIRGASKRALLTTIAITIAVIFGPEFKAVVSEGLAEGVEKFDGEDLVKALTYLAVFGVGSGIRRYYERRAY